MRVLGVDSSTNTGLALLIGDEVLVKELHVGATGVLRLQLIAMNLDRILTAWKPDAAYVENYALSLVKSPNTIITLVEIGTMMRCVLTDHKVPWRTIRPSTLKKWTTGKGNAKKSDMALAVKQRWGFTNGSDDVVDAYALARMGQYLLDTEVEQYPTGVEFGYGAL